MCVWFKEQTVDAVGPFSFLNRVTGEEDEYLIQVIQ
jgi:hypothetical protein